MILSSRSNKQPCPSLRSALMPVAAAVLLSSQLTGCSTIENFVGGDKVDYKTAGGKKSAGLEIPPDLTQLAKDPRYQPASGTVSASALQTPAPVASNNANVVTTVNVGAGAATSLP
ncbi:MAG: hypothetical protein ACKOF9_16240, partial [Burkholderiales bacterium]